MRNEHTVYWVGDEEDGCYQGSTTSRITLLCGLQVMEVPGVMIMENDFEEVQGMWEENLAEVEAGEEGYVLRTVTPGEAQRLYDNRCLVQGEIHAEAQEHYQDGLMLDDNPYAESTADHDEWIEGWMEAYAEEQGQEYDPEEEHLREREEHRADLAASRKTLQRWYHEELAQA